MDFLSRDMDPNYLFFSRQFDKLDPLLTGCLKKELFTDIVSKIIPNTDRLEAESRYLLAEKDGEIDRVPITKLAMIACYLMLNNSFKTKYQVVSQIALIYRDFKNSTLSAESFDILE
jgi:hypothetical protein